MKYTAHYNARVNKYFARSLSSGKTISTDRLMEEIANASTVAPAVQTVHVGGNVDATLYYLPGETWRQAIENHSTENAGFSISGDKVRYNGTRVYIGSFGALNPNTEVDPNGDYRALQH